MQSTVSKYTLNTWRSECRGKLPELNYQFPKLKFLVITITITIVFATMPAFAKVHCTWFRVRHLPFSERSGNAYLGPNLGVLLQQCTRFMSKNSFTESAVHKGSLL
jgi:hypothetical protein